MALHRPEDAEQEKKTRRIMVRMGEEAKDLIVRAARFRGVSESRYLRDSALRDALRDVAEEERPATNDAQRVAHNR